ncbi:hypothetical protein THARTR1_06999 [Trichoderma harzianum]|uniref:Uncharacterized protein n=1 Tax=Trichoderma harzianum TaxID=5544 RepID=A0A2K0U3P1_TRIHA|nr:hypothetical protein THARTR1_06999 [Trichoderma harzianum]
MSKKPCPMPEEPSTESGESPAALVGCLLDVSGSMQKALEVGRPNEPATERLEAVIRAALRVAQSERNRCSNALLFIGVFGLKKKVVESDTEGVSPSVVDLCAVADALLGDYEGQSSGHNLLIARANKEGLSHISKYIRQKLTDSEARILDAHLRENPADVQQFINSIPSEGTLQAMHTRGQAAGGVSVAVFGGLAVSAIAGPVGMAVFAAPLVAAAATSYCLGDKAVTKIEDRAVEESDALSLARRICARWLNNFTIFKPRPVDDVIRILDKLFKHSDTGTELLERSDVKISSELEKVSIATIYLTSHRKVAHRQLYYQPVDSWNDGQGKLFYMATNFSCMEHPVPVLASTGWKAPSEGEARLYAVLSSSAALDEFCSFLVSARPGMADGLLDIIGRINQNAYINDEHVKTCRNPSNQGSSGTCYAHATAGAIHMSLLRIVGREDGYPSIEEIRKRILTDFPAQQGGRNTRSVLNQAVQ